MFNKKRSKHRRVPGINTTSTADISFMLLVFFLITTSIDNNKGILRQMPPPAANQETTLQVKRRNVMLVRLDDNNQLLCDEQAVTHGQLKERIMAFVENARENSEGGGDDRKQTSVRPPCDSCRDRRKDKLSGIHTASGNSKWGLCAVA